MGDLYRQDISLLKNKLQCSFTLFLNALAIEIFKNVFNILVRLSHVIFIQFFKQFIALSPSTSNTLTQKIKHNSKFNDFFNDCIGAIDGTHIAAKVPDAVTPAFRNRKGFISQNVLATCDFDKLIFTYILAGWEGSQHDGAVFESAFDHGFEVSAGKYYLGDAGFGLTPFCLTPYRGVRYHLREWSKAKDRYIHSLIC